MSASVQVSELIARPVTAVFQFHATEHVRNHPRWDPYMRLEQQTEGPIRVGTIIKRTNSRSGSPITGTMEVTEFQPDRSMAMRVVDGGLEMDAKATYEADGPERTRITVRVELPGMDATMDMSEFAGGIQASLRAIKRLLESEAV